MNIKRLLYTTTRRKVCEEKVDIYKPLHRIRVKIKPNKQKNNYPKSSGNIKTKSQNKTFIKECQTPKRKV